MNKIEEAAKRLRKAERDKKVCAPIRDLIGTTDIKSAYEIQKFNTEIRKQSGARIVGHKIGLTAPVVQKQLGVNQPDFGLLWHDKEVINGGHISMKELMQPRAEAEIAFVLQKNLNKKIITTVDVLSAIDYVLPAIEIVGSRIMEWDIKITDTIADNASASHWVIGHRPVKLEHIDVVNCKMSMKNKGAVVSEGVGKACLGSPINAIVWLANKMIEMGSPLEAGALILSGAIGPMVTAKSGDNFEVNIEGLGTVATSFVE